MYHCPHSQDEHVRKVFQNSALPVGRGGGTRPRSRPTIVLARASLVVVESAARLACRSSAILALEQGLGKTVVSLVWALLRGGRRTLVVAPQDLIPQWVSEAERLGITLHRLNSWADVAWLHREQPEGFFVVHYEFLKGTPRPNRQARAEDWTPGEAWNLEEMQGAFKKDVLAEAVYRRRTCPFCGGAWTETPQPEQCPHCKAWNRYEVWDADGKEQIHEQRFCPQCHSVEAWDNLTCENCGFTRYRLRARPVYRLLKHAFDTIVVDEGVKMKNVKSLQGRSVHALHAANKLILSGSPIKNTLPDLFYLLHWAFGEGSLRFPYRFEGGFEQFLDDFCVYEQRASHFEKGNKSERRYLPEITNISMLWKLLGPAILRLTKRDVEQAFVERTTRHIELPLTEEQERVYGWWLEHFADWFAQVHEVAGDLSMVQLRQKILGQLAKLQTAATIPNSAKLVAEGEDGSEIGARAEDGLTLKHVWLIERIKQDLDEGHQIVVFTGLQDQAEFLKREFEAHGIRSVIANGTVPPKDRGPLIQAFKRGDHDVAICGIQAVNMGHNLENASKCYITDFVQEHSTMRQAIERVHRLTSQHPVEVCYLYHPGTIDADRLELIRRKADASDLALDGQLLDEQEERMSAVAFAQDVLARWRGFLRDGTAPTQADLRERLDGAPAREIQVETARREALETFDLDEVEFGEQLSLFA